MTSKKIFSSLIAIAAVACLSTFAEAQTQKATSVKTLLSLTLAAHPYVGLDALAASLPNAKAAAEVDKQNRIESFDAALKVNKTLTPEQMEFVRANYGRLGATVDKIIDDKMSADFPHEQWIKESLQRSYTAKFTGAELTSLITYFQGAAGKQTLNYVRISENAELITGNGGALTYTAVDKTEHDTFAATPLGKKFLTVYLTDAEAYGKRKESSARVKNKDSEDFAILEPANLNTLFNRFVAENYKK